MGNFRNGIVIESSTLIFKSNAAIDIFLGLGRISGLIFNIRQYAGYETYPAGLYIQQQQKTFNIQK